MIAPKPDDFIDIHNHDVVGRSGIFSIDNIMVHESRTPATGTLQAYSVGIHPWFLNENNYDLLIDRVHHYSGLNNVIALGEAGFDKIKGPRMELQKKAFEIQVRIADNTSKPLFIHNVKAWDELLFEYKTLKPKTKWIIHGFQGKKELAEQLLSKGMYLSLWADFVLNRDSSSVIKSIPREKLFLETDAFDVDIKDIYNKVSADLQIGVSELKALIYSNYMDVFGNENIDLSL